MYLTFCFSSFFKTCTRISLSSRRAAVSAPVDEMQRCGLAPPEQNNGLLAARGCLRPLLLGRAETSLKSADNSIVRTTQRVPCLECLNRNDGAEFFFLMISEVILEASALSDEEASSPRSSSVTARWHSLSIGVMPRRRRALLSI